MNIYISFDVGLARKSSFNAVSIMGMSGVRTLQGDPGHRVVLLRLNRHSTNLDLYAGHSREVIADGLYLFRYSILVWFTGSQHHSIIVGKSHSKLLAIFSIATAA